MKHVSIKDHNLVRDIDNMAIINTDLNEFEQYQLKRKLFANQKKEINTIKEEINMLKNDISEIKTILLEILKNAN